MGTQITSQTEIRGRFAAPPVPCSTADLIVWLNAHHNYAIPVGTPFHRGANGLVKGVVGHVQERYGAIPMLDGQTLWPSDAWAHVVASVKRAEGGQRSFFGESEVAR